MTTEGAIPITDIGRRRRDDAIDLPHQPADTGTPPPLSTAWRSHVTAVRSPGTEPWEPSGEALHRARRVGATLRHQRDGYDLVFNVSAPDLPLATRAAMARWARLYEQCTLPDWRLTAVTVTDERAATDLTGAAQRRPGRPRPPRLNRQLGLASDAAICLTTPAASASQQPQPSNEKEPTPIRAAASAS